MSSDGGGTGFRFLIRREGVFGTLLEVFGETGSSDGHSHASGGRHASCCRPLVATGQPSAVRAISSLRTAFGTASGRCALGTGKSKVSVRGDLDSQG